ncbi:hypothetical protein F4814DRAFT_456747 [Daldinia grandis]|nr:hypothetical protein F4814DRAFT_456747 [Daldinia grandis]
MKSSAILVGAAAAVAAAQGSGFPQGFPECGITCVNNMLSQASQLGCSDITPSCLCTKQNFIYGVRDCATESCPDQSVAQQVIQYGSQYCASVGVAVSGIPSATGQNPTASTTVVATDSPTINPSSSQGSASASASSASAASSASGSSTSGGSATQESSSKSLSFTIVTGSYGDVYISMLTDDSASGTGVVVPITTETISTTISGSNGPITSAIASTVFSTSGASASGSVTSGAESGSVTTGVIESSVTTNGSTLVTSITTTGPASSHTSEGSSESTPNGSAESGSSTSNPAAQRTAAPAGLIAAAGMWQIQNITMRRRPRSPPPTLPVNSGSAFMQLPLDIIYLIYNSFLDPISTLSLTLTCTDMFAVISVKSLPKLEQPILIEFLLLLEKDASSPRPNYFCDACTRLHYLDACEKETMFSYSHIINSKNRCSNNLWLSGNDFAIGYHHIRLAMNRHYYGAPRGLPLSSRKWSARAIDGELFLSATHKIRFLGTEGDFQNFLDQKGYQICAHTWTVKRGVGLMDKDEESEERLHTCFLKLRESYNRMTRVRGGISEIQRYWYNPTWSSSRTINSFRSDESTTPMLQSRHLRECWDVPGWCIFCATDYTTTLEKRNVGRWWERRQEEWTLTIVTYHQLGSGRTSAEPKWRVFRKKVSSYSEPLREEFGSLPRSVKKAWDEFVPRGTAE